MILIEDDSIPVPNKDKEIFQEIIIFSQHFPKHNWSTDPLKPHRNLPPLPPKPEALAASKQAAQHGLEARESSELKELRRRQSKDELFGRNKLELCF